MVNIQGCMGLLLIMSLSGRTASQDNDPDNPIEDDMKPNTTMNVDELFDQANAYFASVYDWETDQPNVYPIYNNNYDFNFGYSGGTKNANKYKEKLTEEQKYLSNERKPSVAEWVFSHFHVLLAVVFPLGIRGVDNHGRKTSNVCMGTLIHKEIVMTICACVNSWYRSYRNLKLQEATSERFQISDTSDEQFDIRAPTLVAIRSTWEGFVNKTGEIEYFPITRLTLESPWCTQAVEGSHDEVILNQFKTVAFLQLTLSVDHPVAGTRDSLTVAQLIPADKEMTTQFRENSMYDAFSYFTYTKPKYEGAYLEAEAVPKDVKSKYFDPDSAIELSRQLMSITLQEKVKKPTETIWRNRRDGKGPCDYSNYERFANTYKFCDETKPASTFLCTKDRLEYLLNFRTILNSVEVGCYQKKSSVHLCDLAPGTPIMHDFQVYGLIMANNAIPGSSDSLFCSSAVEAFGFFQGSWSGEGLELRELSQVVLRVFLADGFSSPVATADSARMKGRCKEKQYHVFVLNFHSNESSVGSEMLRGIQQVIASFEAGKNRILESQNNPLPLVNRSGGGVVDISGNLDADVVEAFGKGIEVLGLVSSTKKTTESQEEYFIYPETLSTATQIYPKHDATLFLLMLVEVSVHFVLFR